MKRDRPTPTELRVIQMIADGLTDAQAARALAVSRRAVEGRVARARRAINVTTRTHLIAECLRRGWIR